jgi:ABC-type Mn2+/Zn2+ transport system ATPase subunit
MIKRFQLGKLLVVDETFNNVSPKYLPKVSELLKTLADDDFTIFAISHQAPLADAADHAYTVYPGPELR